MSLSPADDRKLGVLFDLFDSNGDGTINYSEFLFMFVDRQDILKRWQACVTTASPVKDAKPSLAVAGEQTCFAQTLWLLHA